MEKMKPNQPWLMFSVHTNELLKADGMAKENISKQDLHREPKWLRRSGSEELLS